MNIPLIFLLFIALFIFLSSFFTVKQQTAVIVERFGRFLSIRQSGLQLKIPLIDRIDLNEERIITEQIKVYDQTKQNAQTIFPISNITIKPKKGD